MRSDREIYEEVSDDLVRFATALVGPDEAADVVSRVVVRVLDGGSLGRLRSPRPYLMRAVLNESRNQARGRARRSAAVVRIGPGPTVADIADGRYPDLTAAVMALPERQRAALYLVYWCGMSATEAADAMGCRPATVRRYIGLAKAKLRGFDDA